MERVENSARRVCKEVERPCREWWAVLGTVAEAFEGLGSCGFDVPAGSPFDVDGPAEAVDCNFLKYEGGKCFALYVS